MIVFADEAAKHLRIDDAQAEAEGELISNLCMAAQEFIVNATGIDWENRTDDKGKPIEPPYLIKAAILLLVGHYYNHREATTGLTLKEIPLGVQRIIDQHKQAEIY